jgi:hypothetical protein
MSSCPVKELLAKDRDVSVLNEVKVGTVPKSRLLDRSSERSKEENTSSGIVPEI